MNLRQDQDRSCGVPGPREELLETAGFDTLEHHCLELMRLILADMAGGRPKYAQDPASVARGLFGAMRGEVLLAGLTALVQTLAMSRTERFHFSNPYCPGCALILTRDEGHLLRLFHCLRRGAPGRATVQALMLCDARPVTALIDSAADLASLLPRAAAQTAMPQG